MAFAGIEVRLRCVGYNSYAKQHRWDIQIKNRYQDRISVFWVVEPQLRTRYGEKREGSALALSAGGVEDTFDLVPTPCGQPLRVRISHVGESRDRETPTSPQQHVTDTTKAPAVSLSSSEVSEGARPISDTLVGTGAPRLYGPAVQPVEYANPGHDPRPTGDLLAAERERFSGSTRSISKAQITDIAPDSTQLDVISSCPEWSSKFNDITSSAIRAQLERDRTLGWSQFVAAAGGVASVIKASEQQINIINGLVERAARELVSAGGSATPLPSDADCVDPTNPVSALRCRLYTAQQSLLVLKGTIDLVGHCRDLDGQR